MLSRLPFGAVAPPAFGFASFGAAARSAATPLRGLRFAPSPTLLNLGLLPQPRARARPPLCVRISPHGDTRTGVAALRSAAGLRPPTTARAQRAHFQTRSRLHPMLAPPAIRTPAWAGYSWALRWTRSAHLRRLPPFMS